MKPHLGAEITLRLTVLFLFMAIVLIVVVKVLPQTEFTVPPFIIAWSVFNTLAYCGIAYSYKLDKQWHRPAIGVCAAALMGIALVFIIYIYNFSDAQLSPMHKAIWSNLVLLMSGGVGSNALFYGLQPKQD